MSHIVKSGTFIYTAKETRERAAAKAAKSIVDKFCGGSLEKMLRGLVEASRIEPKLAPSWTLPAAIGSLCSRRMAALRAANA